MDSRLVEFAQVLRQNGVRVSTAEIEDAARAACEVGLEPAERFKSTLRATLVKRPQDVEPFDRAFAFFFSGAAQIFEAFDAALARDLEAQGLLGKDGVSMLVAALGRLFPGLSPMAQALLQGDPAGLAGIFRAAVLQLDLSHMESALQTGFFSRRLLSAAGMERTRADLQALEGELRARGLSAQELEIVSHRLGETLRRVEEAARREIERQAQARLKKSSGGLAERPFHALSPSELELAQAAVRRLAEKLKSRITRRQRSRRRGALNVRRTLRRNMSWGGIPMVTVFRGRRPERPEVIVLCDVSDSVRNASRMMLLFMHALQSLFVRVRSFVFVSDLGEVTQLFKGMAPEQAIDLATAGKAISLSANSNYGRALATFAREHLGSVSRRTTVLVIGDGRNNYNPSSAWALADIRRKSKRLLWICPEDPKNWGFGDSEMPAYAKVCHQVVVVQSLEDLDRLADRLVPG